MKNRNNETFYMGHLIRTRPRGEMFALDFETERDGGWWLPDKGLERITRYLKAEGLRCWDGGHRGLAIKKIPKERISDVVRGIGEILADYRCNHTSGRGAG